MFSAGDKAGKNALVGGWWNQYQMPFSRSVVVNVSVVPRVGGPVPKPDACATPCVVVRGYERPATAPAVTLPSGFVVPSGARLELHATDKQVAHGSFVPLLNISEGREAVLFGMGMGLEASPPWGSQNATTGELQVSNDYVEGCWSLLRTHDEELPGQVLGTGLEDFWDSAFGFSIIAPGRYPQPPSTDTDGEVRRCEMNKGQDTLCEVEGAPFQDSSAGVLHFSSVFPPAPTLVAAAHSLAVSVWLCSERPVVESW